MNAAAPSLIRIRTLTAMCALIATCGFALDVHGQQDAAKDIRYGRDIRGILSDRCFQCHGPDTAKRAAGLRLDERDSATSPRKDGPAAIIPGNALASELWRRISSHDPDEMMPPPNANKRPLTEDDKQKLKAWIDGGATYEPHWAFVTPRMPEPPSVLRSEWCRGEIDRFVLARLEQAHVDPSPEADRATLARRVFLDFTGLPPTPEELDAFLGDTRVDAYEQLVSRLMEEEPYRTRTAERLTAPWLDAARYADTCGIHMDNGRQMWAWRDWVLNAFRDNMPYDRFLTEQLAGDLIPNATMAQRVATGFNRNHVTSDEGGAIAEEYLVEYAVDRVNTTSAVFLGLTTGCARCHDHKYDPITQEDFYGMFAYFNSIEEPGLYSQTQDSKRAYEPFMDVPTDEQSAKMNELNLKLSEFDKRMNKPLPGETEGRTAFIQQTIERGAMRWTTPKVLSAASSDPNVKIAVLEDRSVQASGPIPDTEDYVLTLGSETSGQRAILLEALPTPGGPAGAGRASHGNAVLTGVTLESRARGGEWTRVPLRWAWADYVQRSENFDPTNVIDTEDGEGWAFDGHIKPGNRNLLMLAEREFGEADGELRVTLAFRSRFTQHSLGRVRVRTSPLSDEGAAALPVTFCRWYSAGPFDGERDGLFEKAFGPESATTIDLSQKFGKVKWMFDGRLADESPSFLKGGTNVSYVGRVIWSPSAREVDVSLGSDDGFRLFVNSVEVASKQVDRSVAPDQDKAKLPLKAGPNTIVMKIVNTGGDAAYYFRAIESVPLRGDLVQATLPADALSKEQEGRLEVAYRRTASPEFLKLERERADVAKSLADVQGTIARTMVMKELEKPRETFVLTRGVYDKPDKARPVKRGVPKVLGSVPKEAPDNRLGLAQWMTSADNPLAARVAVNRFWEVMFGIGLERTSENFGLQGEWPTHPELLDFLAVDFREHGWDVRRLLKMIATSSAYRQSSRIREDLRDRDADNKLLAYYPRRRLSAEQIRDLALFASGLLKEKLGGASVKPYQPDGLWQETAMPQSNTRIYERGMGDDLWRRTMYTYWKRASPPPALMTLDAPTRESCVLRRPTTNTPLQALVLWNDEQYVEASRLLAQRTLAVQGDDAAKLTNLFRRCTGRSPEPSDLDSLAKALASFRARFAEKPEDAEKLIKIGASPRGTDAPSPELAAWTMIASAILNLHETLTQD